MQQSFRFNKTQGSSVTVKPKVTIYSDGSVWPNPEGTGGWAFLLKYKHHKKEGYGSDVKTTNNRMEMEAALNGLLALNKPCDVTLVSDSQYVLNGISKWMLGWRKRGWVKADGKPVANQDLWEQIYLECLRHNVTTRWVRGHNGHPENEHVDKLANLARTNRLVEEEKNARRRSKS